MAFAERARWQMQVQQQHERIEQLTAERDAAVARAEKAEAELARAQDMCARPAGVCVPRQSS